MVSSIKVVVPPAGGTCPSTFSPVGNTSFPSFSSVVIGGALSAGNSSSPDIVEEDCNNGASTVPLSASFSKHQNRHFFAGSVSSKAAQMPNGVVESLTVHCWPI